MRPAVYERARRRECSACPNAARSPTPTARAIATLRRRRARRPPRRRPARARSAGRARVPVDPRPARAASAWPAAEELGRALIAAGGKPGAARPRLRARPPGRRARCPIRRTGSTLTPARPPGRRDRAAPTCAAHPPGHPDSRSIAGEDVDARQRLRPDSPARCSTAAGWRSTRDGRVVARDPDRRPTPERGPVGHGALPRPGAPRRRPRAAGASAARSPTAAGARARRHRRQPGRAALPGSSASAASYTRVLSRSVGRARRSRRRRRRPAACRRRGRRRRAARRRTRRPRTAARAARAATPGRPAPAPRPRAARSTDRVDAGSESRCASSRAFPPRASSHSATNASRPSGSRASARRTSSAITLPEPSQMPFSGASRSSRGIGDSST